MLGVGCFGALQALRRELERPRNYQGDRKANDDHQHNKSDDPVRNLKKRENLRRDLDKQPSNNPVSNRDLVNIAPLQFSEEIPEIHFNSAGDYHRAKVAAMGLSLSAKDRQC